MMKMFQLISDQCLSPNQFYLLSCIREKVLSVHINIHQETRSLKVDQWLTEDNKLTEKSIALLQEVDTYFKVQKKKVNTQVLGTEANAHIQAYVELFPRIKLPSGKAARTDKNNLEIAFKWFFENYKYSWEIILKASALYVDEYEKKNYLYMQTSQYFIRKQNTDKTWGSELANWCSVVENGDMQIEDNHFSEKVV